MIDCPDYRSRISQFNEELNAFVDLTSEANCGLAWGVKSNIAVKDLPITAGCAAYKNTIAKSDATVISKIRRSGGVILGTVNMHEGALGATTDNPTFGRTHNPWKVGYTPGGSSGGSAVAVAAGLCDVALGTDTMGSVRIPSAYCGVQGHKPTFGIVPTAEVVPLSVTLDHVGPIARDVDTLWKAMKIISGKPLKGRLDPLNLTGLRIGIWTGQNETSLCPKVARGFQEVVNHIIKQKARVREFNPPAYKYAKSRRAGLLISEIEAANFHRISLENPRTEEFSKEFIDMLLWGLRQSADKKTAAYRHVKEIRHATNNIWSDFDFVLSPTAPQQAFRFENQVPDNQADFTAWANFANLPATSVYTAHCEDGLPLAIQVIAPTDRDHGSLRLAKTLESLFGKPPMPPRYSFSNYI